VAFIAAHLLYDVIRLVAYHFAIGVTFSMFYGGG
jgi:hypothetical protein